MDKNSLLKTLNKAIEMEEKGHNFYKDASRNTENNITKKTFEFLANNEIFHIENIKKFYKSLMEKGEFPKIDLAAVKDRRAKDLSIFSKGISELKDKIRQSKDDEKACEFAMEFEKNGYRYYEDMLKDADEENLIKLLKFLLSEESSHYEGIMHLYQYLTDSHNWFMYEEGSFPQGG